MKEKIFSISLLLTFMALLCHEMIPHHHHDVQLDDFSIVKNTEHHSHEHNHHHHTTESDRDHDHDTEKEHDHNFPFHQHIADANDFDCLRAELTSQTAFEHPILVFSDLCTPYYLTKPPGRDFIRPPEIFLIPNSFHPKANGLRAPPVMA